MDRRGARRLFADRVQPGLALRQVASSVPTVSIEQFYVWFLRVGETGVSGESTIWRVFWTATHCVRVVGTLDRHRIGLETYRSDESTKRTSIYEWLGAGCVASRSPSRCCAARQRPPSASSTHADTQTIPARVVQIGPARATCEPSLSLSQSLRTVAQLGPRDGLTLAARSVTRIDVRNSELNFDTHRVVSRRVSRGEG